MELSEVVSAHFAFPVVGVVLCAVLVFAFGFKSPAQPPSFDLLDDDDDRKYKKSRQKKHKLNIDGHVINIDGHGSPGVKVITKQQTTLSRQATNEKQEPQVTKVKTKKLKPVTDTGIVNENRPKDEEDAGATGEWTKAVSKKDRKNRSKKDDGPRKDDTPPAAATADRASSHEIQKAVQVAHPTVVHSRDEVHSNRTQRRAMEVTVTAPAPAPVPVFVSCTAVPSTIDAASVNPDSFSSRVKAAVVSVTITSSFQSEPQKSTITNREQTIKTSSPASIPKPLQPTPSKGSEAVAANVVQLPGDDHDAKVSVAMTTGVKSPAEDKRSEKCKDPIATITVGESKSVRSPKKKKKNPESREMYKESPVVTIPSDVTASSATVTAEPRPIGKPVNRDTPPAEDIQMVTTRSASVTEASTSCVLGSPLPSEDRSAEKTCSTNADNSLPLRDSKKTANVAHPASDSKTTANVAHPASDSKTTASVVANPASDSKTTASVVANPASDSKTTASVVVHPASDSKTTARVVVHPASDSKTTASVVVHPASDSKTTASVVVHPAGDCKTTASVTLPASDIQPVGDLQPASDNYSGGDSQPLTLTDELGDWQEARPLKKKRRPHREN